jgi:hypothetical protein
VVARAQHISRTKEVIPTMAKKKAAKKKKK